MNAGQPYTVVSQRRDVWLGPRGSVSARQAAEKPASDMQQVRTVKQDSHGEEETARCLEAIASQAPSPHCLVGTLIADKTSSAFASVFPSVSITVLFPERRPRRSLVRTMMAQTEKGRICFLAAGEWTKAILLQPEVLLGKAEATAVSDQKRGRDGKDTEDRENEAPPPMGQPITERG
ncbi:hypothetical protein VTO42DRAFT_2269 [Malbranchea cinnamomea]